MEHSTSFSDERLLAELEWVRALARQLVNDAGLAEDVVQETWILAHERPPRTRAVRGLRRWLARVARSV
ncbi:MAG: RNA polymerase subunit sigma-24, partial [Planctomycetes bacterium]|nr:RNA polymerase subunit sigma-24 [Planctomycetota bacterium]